MNEPRRLSASGSPFAKQLLLAGRAERPRDDVKVEAIAAAVSIASKHRALFFVKKAWIGWLLLVLGAGASGALVASSGVWSAGELADEKVIVDHSVPFVAPRRLVASGPLPASEGAAVTVTVTGTQATSARPRLPAPSLPAPTEARPTELELMRRARLASATGDPAAALAMLDEHARLHPSGTFREEAAALRVEALARSGNASAARAAADRFAKAYRESVYAERVRSIAASAANERGAPP